MKKLSDDERIKSEINGIYANTFKIMLISIILVIFYKLVLQKSNFSEVMDLNIVLLVAFLYIIINFICKGLFNMKFISGKSSKFYIFATSLLASIVFTIFMNINDFSNVPKIVAMGFVFFIIMCIILFAFTKISNGKN
ncbi:DUF6773 family protein [Clostridium thermobutyricum]|uniref:DUF6773 family protein n=1 Tax=Clostridium thermobutyricum TaxID=29372 RepID=UPI0018AB3168|nr:DUF6773 family protein [Clostridium thermobutyricum]